MSAVPDQIGLGRQRPHPLAESAGLDFTSRLLELRGVGAPSLGGFCRSDGMQVDIQPLSGDFDVDPPMLDVLLTHLQEAAVGDGSVWGNAATASRGVIQGATQRNARLNLERLHDRIASGAIREARINQHMKLYNANPGKGRPRIRVRVTNLPVSVLAPIGGAKGWRTNRAGTMHSANWRDPSPAARRHTAAMAGELSWNSRMGWLTGRAGTGILTFAPQAVLDAHASVQWDETVQNGRRYNGMDWNEFAVRSARNQSGNAVGLAVGYAGAAVLGSSKIVGVAAAAAVAGAPLVIIGLGIGLLAVVAWNASGMNERAGRAAERALGR